MSIIKNKKLFVSILPFAMLCLTACNSLCKPDQLTLVKDGKPQSAIVLGEKPTKSAQLGALELQEHIKLMTGATLPIVDEKAKVDGIKLIIGDSKAAKEAGASSDFKDEEYVIQFKPNAIVMVGNDKPDTGKVNYRSPKYPDLYDYNSWPDLFENKGTLFAVYDFLEKYCDVRWFDQSEFGTDIPETKTLTVTVKDLRTSPAFRYRDPQGRIKGNMGIYDRQTSNWTTGWSKSTPKFQEWLNLIYEKGKKLPVCKHPHRWLGYERGQVFAFLLRRKLGGEKFKTNHSLYNWYSRFWEKNPKHPEVFEGKKPLWFARGYPDAKVPPQLCYTNPEVVEQCIKDMHAFYSLPKEERAKSRLGTDKFYPVVPMDNSSYCKCAECLKLGPSKRVSSGFSSGDNSKMIWTFVNKVAKALKKSYPDKYIAALAYSTYAFRPKDVDIEDNIAVQLCLFPRAACTNPEGLKRDDMILNQWADGRPIYLWIYTALTTGHKPKVPMFPKPMGSFIGPLFQKYHKAGVKGMFFDGMAQETDMYLFFKLAEDPYQDYEQLLDDYFVRMYGPKAGKTLKEFYKTVEKIYANPRNYPKGARGPNLHWGILGTEPRMKKLADLVAKAEKELKNGTELQKKRFKMFKFGTWDYMTTGREKYLKTKVSKASKPVAVSCPAVLNQPPNGDLNKVDWRDAQSFNKWAKDSGDITLRKIDGALKHDGKYLYIKFNEEDLIEKPSKGDNWEILIFDKKTPAVYSLEIDAEGKIKTRMQGPDGVPQEWADAGVKALSKVSKKRWEVVTAIPLKKKLLDSKGTLFMNCRRNDAKGEDCPVWVATGGNFKSGKTGVVIRFDTLPPKELPKPSRNGLIMEWTFTDDGNVVKDTSGHGNNGRLEKVKVVDDNGIKAIRFEGPQRGQYVEVKQVKGFKPEQYTFSCWLKFPPRNTPGHVAIFTVDGTYFSPVISFPYQKLFLRWKGKNRKMTGSGLTGAELLPDQWHQFVMTYDGKFLSCYEDGRLRLKLPKKRIEILPKNITLRIGGAPKCPPWYSMRGEIAQVEMYDRALPAEEILATYKKEISKYRGSKK